MTRADRRRWLELHRRISAAGYLPQATLEGCERQAAMLDSGELKPMPPPSEELKRAVENDRKRHESYDIEAENGRRDADAEWAEYVWSREVEELELAEQEREWALRPEPKETE